jgi:hypothetical protein
MAAAQAAQAAGEKEGTFVMPQYPIEAHELPWANGVPTSFAGMTPPAGGNGHVAPTPAPAAPAAAPAATPKVVRMPAPAAPAASPVKAPARAPAAAPIAPAVQTVPTVVATPTGHPRAMEVALAVLAASGGVLEVGNVPTAVFNYIKDSQKDLVPERTEILKTIRTPGFLESLPGVSVADGVVTGG